jgi:hypothetical protein
MYVCVQEVGRRQKLIQRSNMLVQSVLLALDFFLRVLLAKYSSKLGICVTPMHVSKFIYTGEARSVSASGIYVIFPQFVVHWNSNFQVLLNKM